MLVIAMVLASQVPQQPANFLKGSHLYGSCQAAVRMTDNPNSQQARTELASSTYCFGYLAGYIDALNVLTNKACLNGASLNTVARAYVNFMQRNPALLEEAKALGVVMALKDSFSCPK